MSGRTHCWRTGLLVVMLLTAGGVAGWSPGDATASTHASARVTWQELGPRAVPNLLIGFGPQGVNASPATLGLPAAGEVTTVAVDPSNPSVMYVGAGGGMWWGGGPSGAGVFGTTDGGTTWTPLDAGLTSTSIASLWIDPQDPTILLCATTDGLFRTTTSGGAWTRVASGAQRAIVALGDTIYVGGDGGLLTSSDGGVTWQLVPGTSEVTAVAAGGGEVMAGEFSGAVLVGTGRDFRVVAAPTSPPIGWSALAIDPTDPAVAYGAAAGTSQAFRTSDGGVTWTPLTFAVNPINAHFTVRTIALDPANASTVYIGGDEVLTVSTDGGQTFTGTGVGLDIWGLVPDPGVAGAMLVVTDQGLYRMTEQGAAWASLNGDLTTGLTYAVAVSGSTILAREQDFSIIASFDGGATWQMLTAAGGENGDLVFSPSQPSNVYGIGTADGLTWSSDGGHTWTSVANVDTFAPGDQTVAISPLDPSTVDVATNAGVVATHDGGATWALTGWPMTNADLVAIDPANASHILVGTHDANAYPTSGELHVTSDGGSTWQTVDIGSFPSSVAFLAGDVFVGTNAGVVVSHDGGVTFQSDSEGLPVLPTVLASELWPAVESLTTATSGATTVLIASTTDGVFAQIPGQTPWVDVSGDLRARFVHQAVVSGGDLYLATYGQGVVRAPLSSIVAAVTTPTSPMSLTGAVLQVRARSAAGRPVARPVPGDLLVVTLVPRPAGLADLLGSCAAGSAGHAIPPRARAHDARGALTCTWRVPSFARRAIVGWIALQSATVTERRSFRVALATASLR